MAVWERKEAHETLQVFECSATNCQSLLMELQKRKKDYERGEVQKEFESRGGEIVSLIDDDSDTEEANLNPNKKRALSASSSSSQAGQAKRVKVEGATRVNAQGNHIKSEPGVANDQVSVTSASQAEASVAIKDEGPANVADLESADDELERKIAKAKRLREQIEREERLDKLKRDQDALEEEIEAARRKKAGK